MNNLEIENILSITREELNFMIEQFQMVYDIVRLVDPSIQKQITYHRDGTVTEAEDNCFEVWHRTERCKNCVSSIAMREKTRVTKFEFIKDQIYHVTSQYLIVDGQPVLLEIVENETGIMFDDPNERNALIGRINDYTNRVFQDSLTRISNRRYFDEQIQHLNMKALVMVDVDHFKEVNDTFGHKAGDEALEKVAKILRDNVRNGDSVIRYGGDEFVIAFPTMEEIPLRRKLWKIREDAVALKFENFPDLRVTLSIGCYFGEGTPEKNLERADRALYQAKEKRNTVCIKTAKDFETNE